LLEPPAQRRLTTIVAIDIVGYSAMTEADEGAAAAHVGALAARIAAAACERNGGRVFNTAGDGFMLEFPAVSGAVAAADDLVAIDDPPIRVGVHLGEVLVTPAGDLLGHGVNVAARLQAIAPPGGVLVSADVRRALRGPLAQRLVPRGQVRLDKMDETLAVYALAPAGTAPAPKLVRRRLSWLIGLAAAAVGLALIGGAIWFSRAVTPRPGGDPKVAVLPFNVLTTDPQARYFADGLADEISGVMSANQMLLVPAADAAGLRGAGAKAAVGRLDAAFLLDGSIERDGDAFRIRVRLMNARDQVTLWSDVFSGPASDPAALQIQVAASATDMMGWALDARRRGGDALDDATLAAFLQANGLVALGGPDNALKARSLLQRVVARAPGLSRGHSTLAVMAGVAARSAPPDQARALMQEVRTEAARALAIDPNNGEAYLALNNVAGETNWAERERRLLRGLALEPEFPYLNNNYSYMLGGVGRSREAIAAGERGLALNALHPGANFKYAQHLSQAGRYDAARAAIDQTVRQWPKAWTDVARISIVMTEGPLPDAETVFQRSAARPFAGEAPTLEIWRAVLAAKQSGAAADRARAVAAVTAGVAEHRMQREDAIPALSGLGAMDAAFAVAGQDVDGLASSGSNILFAPATAAMRRDPRFWPLAARLGLTRYWRTTHHWPDVCLPGGDLKDCEARAAAAEAAPPGQTGLSAN
jgi:adenylate cyclase